MAPPPASLLCAGLCVLGVAAMAAAHGSLVIPPARNNHGQKSPANTTGNPQLDQGPCVGGACLWFSEGCFLGCPSCSATMPVNGNQYGGQPPNCSGYAPLRPTLPAAFRTYNKQNRSGQGDWTQYHPWRAPGHAPVSDSCGVAGGYKTAQGGGGQTPTGAHQGDKGSALPPTEKTVWRAGGTAEVGWMIAANHGGGYHYSLCPSGEPITEACLNKNPLAFADETHTIRYVTNGSEITIPAVDVSEGTFPAGSTWRVNPIPACACDSGRGCKVGAAPGLNTAYWGCPTYCAYRECGKGVPLQDNATAPFPGGYGQQIWDRQRPAPDADDWIIVDRITVPTTPGSFVLRWRWDTEQNPQIWTHCADITIAA